MNVFIGLEIDTGGDYIVSCSFSKYYPKIKSIFNTVNKLKDYNGQRPPSTPLH